MKFAGVCILFICLFAATFSKWFMIAAYKINEQYISQQLCENKSNLSLNCNGQCYLNKQLDKEEKPASPFNTNSTEKFEIQLFCIELPQLNQLQHLTDKKKLFACRQNFISRHFIQKIYPPPKS